MYIINSVDNAELPCYTLPPTQHHTFFRKLPLFSSHHLVITVVILSTQVYQWWKSTKRVPYPSTLYVTLKGVQPPKTIDPSLRSMFAIQQVCLFFSFSLSFVNIMIGMVNIRVLTNCQQRCVLWSLSTIKKNNSCNTETLKLVANIYFLFEKLQRGEVKKCRFLVSC